MDTPVSPPGPDEDDSAASDLDTVARALDALDADDLDEAERLADALVDGDGEAAAPDA